MCGQPLIWPAGVNVLSLDLDSRENPSLAEDVVFRASKELGSSGQVFLKIDSTLRGPIEPMVRGALRGSGKPVAVVAPGFPEQGRVVRDGRLFVNGTAGPRVADVLGGLEVMIVDDVDQVAANARRHSEWLLVGSAGLARRLAPPPPPPVVPSRAVGPLLVVAGTPAAATRAQLERLDALEDLEDVVVVSTPTSPSDERDAGESARALAEVVLGWSARSRPRAIVLTGGATARAVCDRLRVHALRIRGELSPGIPFGTLEGGQWSGVPVVTKAGGFGVPETLLNIARALS